MNGLALPLRDRLLGFFQGHDRKDGHLLELDGVRACSIFLVLASHLLPLGPSALRLNETAGLMGMSLFFCLSGFLITSFLWIRPEVKPFLIRRAARILPLLYLYAALTMLVLSWRPEAFWATLTFTLNYNDAAFDRGVQWIGHLWSLGVEGHFYIAIALAIGLFGRRGFWLVPVAAVAVLAMRIHDGAYVSTRTHLRVDEILSGSVLALWWLNRNRVGPGGQGWPALDRWIGRLLPVFCVLWLMSCSKFFGPVMYLRPWFAMLTIASVMRLATDSKLRRVLSGPFLGYIATTSYAIYIWHGLFAQPLLKGGGLAVKYLINRPVTFAATFLVSHLSTFHFEQFFVDWARRFTTRRRQGPTP